MRLMFILLSILYFSGCVSYITTYRYGDIVNIHNLSSRDFALLEFSRCPKTGTIIGIDRALFGGISYHIIFECNDGYRHILRFEDSQISNSEG